MRSILVKLTFLVFAFATIDLFANMASPIVEGTKSASIIVSKEVDVLSESIHIRPDIDFKTADFSIVYNIKTDRSGKLPLMFLALDYADSFSLKIDGIPIYFIKLSDSAAFVKRLGINDTLMDNEGNFHIRLYSHYIDNFKLKDLLYFEPFLRVGEHKIEVHYKANCWMDLGGEIIKKELRYSLSPAKYWRSFGRLNVVYDNSDFSKAVTWNLDSHMTSEQRQILKADFNQLPSDFILITYVPSLKFGDFISVGTADIVSTILFLVLLVYLFYKILKYRKESGKRPFVFIVIGFLILPVIVLFIREWMLNYGKGSDLDVVSYQRDYGTFLYFPFQYLMYILFLILVFSLSYTYQKRRKKDKLE